MRMIQDCRDGKIQRVLVKSISRFARNTVDALNYIRELKDLGISVFFESENIDTLTPGGEVLITILAAMAEQESRTMSTNIKWSYQKKFKNGEVMINTGMMLGYLKKANGEYGINEEEAEIVRRIYREFVSGVTVTRICRELEMDGIPTKLGKKKWRHSVIVSILSNEKYIGNAILGKTFKPDVLTKNRIRNTGQAPMYYVEGTHPAIIDKELFEMAKNELQRHRDDKDMAVGSSRYSSKYPFSGLLVCGDCGCRLRRHARRVGSGKTVPAWGCTNRIKNGRIVCNSHHVNEDVLERTYLAAIKDMLDCADEVIAAVRDSAEIAMQPTNAEVLDAVDKQIFEVQEAVLALHKAKQQRTVGTDEYAWQIQQYSQRIKDLEDQQEQLRAAESRYSEVRTWLDNFEQHIKNADTMNMDDGTILKALVEQIIISDEGMEIHFKCGVKTTREWTA